MNIYEDEHLERKFQQVTDQNGLLPLDLITVNLIKINSEHQIFKDFEKSRLSSFKDEPNF